MSLGLKIRLQVHVEDIVYRRSLSFAFDTILGILNRRIPVPKHLLYLTEDARVGNRGERLVLRRSLESVKYVQARSWCYVGDLACLSKYEWALSLARNMVCLDEGCGTGYGTHYLASKGMKSIIGIDISPEAIDLAQKHYKNDNLDFAVMDALSLDFENDHFDAVVSFDLLEHIKEESQDRFVAEIGRVLKGKGIAILGSPNRTASQCEIKFHEKELAQNEFESLLKKAF